MFAAFALVAGGCLVWLSLWLRSRSRACLHWPSVAGQVIESRVDDEHLEMMKPVLRYRYEVTGQTYVGFRVAFSGYGAGRPAMEQLIQPYPAGASVTVYYDPRNPASAVLDNTARSDWVFWLLFGVGFLVLGAILAR